MKRIGRLLIACIAGWLGAMNLVTVQAEATELHELHFEVELQENGAAEIIERQVITVTEGTENFMPHQELTEEQISHFEVFVDGEPMDWQEEWDSEATREEKGNEYGILDTDGGIEFVWGIPDYGEHTYELHYTIEEVVWQLEDGQSMNWTFFRGDGGLSPDEMSLELRGPGELTADNTTLALLGLEGANWELRNGTFYAEQTEGLASRDNIILWMQFE